MVVTQRTWQQRSTWQQRENSCEAGDWWWGPWQTDQTRSLPGRYQRRDQDSWWSASEEWFQKNFIFCWNLKKCVFKEFLFEYRSGLVKTLIIFKFVWIIPWWWWWWGGRWDQSRGQSWDQQWGRGWGCEEDHDQLESLSLMMMNYCCLDQDHWWMRSYQCRLQWWGDQLMQGGHLE